MIARHRRPALIGALIGVPLLAAALAGCANKKGDLVVDDSVGVTALRNPCPTVGIPDYTGDITTFTVPGSTDAAAIDVVAAMTHLRSTCSDTTDKLYTVATFDVLARRADTRGARHVELPFFSSVIRGGSAVISKRVGTVAIDFADGQARATGKAEAAAYVDRAEATLPEEIRQKLSRKRRAGDADAAIDPLAQPEVRTAIAKASFELLVGFQLDDKQLAYNATR
ncbi:hypothetical protein [Novosphingobium lentum]|uniref:hypothetical protein n=1 Tax=Novosphingobium lentum TaxID=145287 RepID=UPI00083613FD|nr:hypothetical protein [Novosphingobium lentum]